MMESARGVDSLFPDSYGATTTPLFRPPIKFHLHRPFEDHIVRRPTDSTAMGSISKPVASYLQYPDVHSTGLPLLLPPAPASFQQHPLGAFQTLYQHQKMQAAEAAASAAETERPRRHDDSRDEEDDRSRSPDSPTQLTGDESAGDDGDDADESTSSLNHRKSASPAAPSRRESIFNTKLHISTIGRTVFATVINSC